MDLTIEFASTQIYVSTLAEFAARTRCTKKMGSRNSGLRLHLRRIFPQGVAELIYDYYFPIDPKELNGASTSVIISAFITAAVYKNMEVIRHI